MLSKSEFLNHVHGQIFPQLKRFEIERTSVLRKWCLGMIVVAVALTAVAFYYIGFDRMMQKEYLFYVPCATFFIPIWIGSHKLTLFSNDLKQKFIPTIFAIFKLNLDEIEGGTLYWKKGNLNDKLNDLTKIKDKKNTQKFISSVRANLFPSDLTMFSYDSCFSNAENTFSVCEVKLSRSSGRSYIKLFEGVMVELKTKIKINSKILILQKTSFMSSKHFKPKNESYEEVLTNDPVFDKYFHTYIENEAEAENVLNEVFLRKILSVCDVYPKSIINILIENGKITISINTNENMFEFFSIYRSLVKDKFFEQFYNEINTLYKVREIFNDQ